MNVLYESKLPTKRWSAYDLPGNVGWIVWIVCLILLLTQGVTWFTIIGTRTMNPIPDTGLRMMQKAEKSFP